jgi:site-specific DNA-methyltransferase (cytosine-N4-specific)
MPESVSDRCTRSHEQIFLLTKSARYFYDAEAIKELSVYPDDDRKGRALESQKRMPTNQVSGIRPRKQDALGKRQYTGFNDRYDNSDPYPTRNKRTVWTIATQPFTGSHYAVYPEKLIEPCILAGSRPGDIVFDPFSGSGTTGRVALRYGRRYVGLELKMQYIRDFTQDRLTVQPMMTELL